jgi:hypothetical protein
LRIAFSIPYSSAKYKVITILTLFTLFGSDIKVIVFDKRADPAFDVVSFIALGFFTVEIGT